MSAKGQIAVEVTREISPHCALLLAGLEMAAIYSCSPTDLKTGSKYWAFCSVTQSPLQQRWSTASLHHIKVVDGGVSPAEPFCTHLARLQFIFRQSCEWLSEEESEKEHFSGNVLPRPETKLWFVTAIFKKWFFHQRRKQLTPKIAKNFPWPCY